MGRRATVIHSEGEAQPKLPDCHHSDMDSDWNSTGCLWPLVLGHLDKSERPSDLRNRRSHEENVRQLTTQPGRRKI
ncbi:MAG: hypothetical protein ACI9BW_004070 [Gammaproteobacteria bacterium]|jgi:hypothetical protein